MRERPPLRLAVIGDPVAHSASPALHRAFLAASGRSGTYEAIRVPAGSGGRSIDELRAAGYVGLNVTTPLKEEAFARADVRDAASLASGAVNTLVLGAQIAGYNTDGVGALGALREAGFLDLVARRVLVLGAGPTARAVVAALVAADAVVAIWNRTPERARAIAHDLDATLWHDGFAPEAVFSTVSPGARFSDEALVAALFDAPIVIDANYGERSTLAAVLGRSVIDGATMLEASARASFAHFAAR